LELEKQLLAGTHSRHIEMRRNQRTKSVERAARPPLKRRAIADAHDISVTVNGADVTLSGIVHSWSERELARESAWGTPGVRNVLDNMTLVFET